MTRISARLLAGTEGPFGRGIAVRRPEGVPEGSVVTVLRVPPEVAGMRLDRFVQSQLKRTSRTRAQEIVARGAFSPDARRLRGNDRVKAEQCILLWRAPWDEHAPDLELPVLFEDDHLLAIDKPAGAPVHPTARYHASTVVKRLEAARPGQRLMLAHRLDRETSGVLLLSKTPEADRRVKMQFENRTRRGGGPALAPVLKRYLAIVWGWPEWESRRIDLPLELDPTSRYKVKMRVGRGEGALLAATGCEVVERRARATDRRYALIACTLETGRQHQIRVHLAATGTPVVGDKLYGPDEALFARGADRELTDGDREVLELDRHALHAEVLEIEHPIQGGRVRIEAPLPPDLRAFWDSVPLSPSGDGAGG